MTSYPHDHNSDTGAEGDNIVKRDILVLPLNNPSTDEMTPV
jgi:hypothetical protein